jgi:hypothetical protein
VSLLRLLAAAAALLAASRGFAAPVPPPVAVEIPTLERHLPDDTHSVLVYNVKPIVSSALYKKHLKKSVEQFLRSEGIAAFCKATGVSPLKDIQYLAYVTDPRFAVMKAYPGEPGGYLLIVGRFDRAKLHKALRGLAKSGRFKINGEGDAAIYEHSTRTSLGRFHVGVIDQSAVVIASDEEQIDAVRAKRMAGKSAFKDRDLPALLKQLRGNVAVSGFGTEGMGLEVTSVQENVPGGVAISYKSTPLRDKGLRSLLVRVELGDKLNASVTLTGRDKTTFAKNVKAVKKEIEKWGEELGKARPNERIGPAAVMAKLLTVARPRTAGLQLTYDAALDGPAVKEMIDGFLKLFNRPPTFSPIFRE